MFIHLYLLLFIHRVILKSNTNVTSCPILVFPIAYVKIAKGASPETTAGKRAYLAIAAEERYGLAKSVERPI